METKLTPERIIRLGLGFRDSRTLLSAIELGLFTELARSGPVDAEALRLRLGLHPRGARDFFDSLVALRMLERHDGVYRNTPETAMFLDRGKPSYAAGLLEMVSDRVFSFWGGLTESLRTGRPQSEAKESGNLFEGLYSDPVRLKYFAKAMTALSAASAKAIAQKFPWKDHRSVIDIGCAEGGVPVQVALAHPHITGGGFDLPGMAPVFREFVDERGLGDRLKFYPGDFFKDPLPKADVLIMGHILHDWSMDDKRMLISKAYQALPEGGALIVYETLIDDDRRENVMGLMMSLNMLIQTSEGFDYTGADCSGWLKEAGFKKTRVEHLAGAESMVVGIK
jgi:hypothetical protein